MSTSIEVKYTNHLADIQVQQVGSPIGIEVNLAIPGPPGPPGPQGTSGAGYTHIQDTLSSLWAIAHNLGYLPSVSVFTVGGLEMVGSVLHTSNNVTQISFNVPVMGTARLN